MGFTSRLKKFLNFENTLYNTILLLTMGTLTTDYRYMFFFLFSGVLFSGENYQSEIALNSTLHKKNTFDQKAFFKSVVKKVSNSDYFEASKTCK